MIDNDMTNILRNFSGAEEGTGEIVGADGERKVSTAATEKNAMKSLLEGLDAQQRSVNQMPGQHKMAKSTDTAHPAEKFLVGGEFEEETNLSQDQVDLSKWEKKTNEAGYGDFDDDPTDTSDLFPMDKANKYAPGTPVHVGHMTPHGSGIEGEVVKVVGDVIYIKNADGKTYKGQLKNTTVNEMLGEAKSAINFGPEDLQKLNTMSDLGAMKDYAMSLISTPSDRPMKPEKVEWFRRSLERMTNKNAVIKMMYDLLLSGEGQAVVGSGASMKKNTYRDRFNEGEWPWSSSKSKENQGKLDAQAGRPMKQENDLEGKDVADTYSAYVRGYESVTKDTNEDTIAKRKTGSDVHKKQSFKDVFRSMDETEDDMVTRFKKELHDEKSKKALNKGDNGKFNLAEDDLSWGDELIEDLKLLVQEASEYDGIIDTQSVIDIIQKYEV